MDALLHALQSAVVNKDTDNKVAKVITLTHIFSFNKSWDRFNPIYIYNNSNLLHYYLLNYLCRIVNTISFNFGFLFVEKRQSHGKLFLYHLVHHNGFMYL